MKHSTRTICSDLKIQYPIIQAPMAGFDSPEFIAAASNAGVLGSLGAQYRTVDDIKKTIGAIKALTDKPFAVNVFALPDLTAPSNEAVARARSKLKSYYEHFAISEPTDSSVQNGIKAEEQWQTILQCGVPVLSFTLGMLSDHWIAAFKKAGTYLIGTATNVKEALALEAAGIDAISAQGCEAGGHRGTFIGSYEKSMIGNFALIPQIADVVKKPVIAAGGIMDGRAIAAAFALGAQGVQLGTAFLTTDECPIHINYKTALQTHDADDTVITKVFSGGAARGIENEYIRSNSEDGLLPFPYQNALTKPFRKCANESGQIEFTNLWSGQAGKLARRIKIAELVKALMTETDVVISNLQKVEN